MSLDMHLRVKLNEPNGFSCISKKNQQKSSETAQLNLHGHIKFHFSYCLLVYITTSSVVEVIFSSIERGMTNEQSTGNYEKVSSSVDYC
jgi:hypothetical protein